MPRRSSMSLTSIRPSGPQSSRPRRRIEPCSWQSVTSVSVSAEYSARIARSLVSSPVTGCRRCQSQGWLRELGELRVQVLKEEARGEVVDRDGRDLQLHRTELPVLGARDQQDLLVELEDRLARPHRADILERLVGVGDRVLAVRQLVAAAGGDVPAPGGELDRLGALRKVAVVDDQDVLGRQPARERVQAEFQVMGLETGENDAFHD